MIQGIGFGLLIAVLLGPVFFALIQTSITRGFKAGAAMALGIVASDALYIFVSFYGLMRLVQGPETIRWIGIIGGFFMLGYGIYLMLSRQVSPPEIELPELKVGRILGSSVAKGFFLNVLNPFVLVYWLGVTSFVSAVPHYDKTDKMLFFVGTLGTILVTDLMKTYGAKKLRRFVTRNLILWLNRISGSVLLVFGIKILIDVLVLNKSFIPH